MSQDDAPSLDLLNIYEIEDDGRPRHLVCFVEPVLAGARGIEARAVVGDFDPGPDGDFDPATFRLNPDFVVALTDYMNAEGLQSDELIEQASLNPDSDLFLIDPRLGDPNAEPPPSDLLGWFHIDERGRPVPGSFQYNDQHMMFDPRRGPSHILRDRSFYDWLHPDARPAAE